MCPATAPLTFTQLEEKKIYFKFSKSIRVFFSSVKLHLVGFLLQAAFQLVRGCSPFATEEENIYYPLDFFVWKVVLQIFQC